MLASAFYFVFFSPSIPILTNYVNAPK